MICSCRAMSCHSAAVGTGSARRRMRSTCPAASLITLKPSMAPLPQMRCANRCISCSAGRSPSCACGTWLHSNVNSSRVRNRNWPLSSFIRLLNTVMLYQNEVADESTGNAVIPTSPCRRREQGRRCISYSNQSVKIGAAGTTVVAGNMLSRRNT